MSELLRQESAVSVTYIPAKQRPEKGTENTCVLKRERVEGNDCVSPAAVGGCRVGVCCCPRVSDGVGGSRAGCWAPGSCCGEGVLRGAAARCHFIRI